MKEISPMADVVTIELQRLDAVHAYRALGDKEDPAFDRITDLASRIYRVPVATISLVDEEQVWFKSHYGVEARHIDREGSPSNVVIGASGVLAIPDVLKDARFESRPPNIGGMRVRFYAGAPLITPEGYRIGALSIIDTRPRPGLSEEEAGMLQDLSALVMDEFQLQLELARMRSTSKSLQESEAKFRALMESASQGVIGVNRAGAIQLVNRKAEELFGYRREDLIGRPIEILLPNASREKHVSDRAHYFSHPRARPMGIGLELRGMHRDGHEFPVEISLNHLEINGGAMAISFITDITERTRLEQQLRQSQKMEAIGQLAGGVAHDFNNLLTVISGYSALALEGLGPGDRLQEPLEQIAEAAVRAGALTQQLLAFSRKQLVQPRRFDLNERVTQMHKILRRLIGEDIQLDLALGEHLGEILADPGQVDQVIINLVVNARDAMPNGGRLLIETADVELGEQYAGSHLSVQPGPHVMLAVTDTGVGMTAEVHAHIFEPFYTTKEAGKGTGLGLATVYGIVKQAGGSIFVYSELSHGTTFKILFPRVVGPAAVETDAEEAAHPAEGGTVLLVEDEDAVRTFVRTMLDERGYRVLEATNGEEARDQLARHGHEVDLILTDVVMPKVNGPDLIASIRAAYPGVKVLYMSGYTDRTVPLEGDAGAAFIQKPFTPNQLEQKIREVVNAG
jgi:PAS domain S-box-containing protein